MFWHDRPTAPIRERCKERICTCTYIVYTSALELAADLRCLEVMGTNEWRGQECTCTACRHGQVLAPGSTCGSLLVARVVVSMVLPDLHVDSTCTRSHRYMCVHLKHSSLCYLAALATGACVTSFALYFVWWVVAWQQHHVP